MGDILNLFHLLANLGYPKCLSSTSTSRQCDYGNPSLDPTKTKYTNHPCRHLTQEAPPALLQALAHHLQGAIPSMNCPPDISRRRARVALHVSFGFGVSFLAVLYHDLPRTRRSSILTSRLQATAPTDGVQIVRIVSGLSGNRCGEPALASAEKSQGSGFFKSSGKAKLGGGGGDGKKSDAAAGLPKVGRIKGGGSVIPVALYRKANARYTLIYSHGNATDIGAMHDRCAGIAEAVGVNVLAYDYTGYGCARWVSFLTDDVPCSRLFPEEQLRPCSERLCTPIFFLVLL